MNEPPGMFPGAGNGATGAYEATGFPQSTGAAGGTVVVVVDRRRAASNDRSSRSTRPCDRSTAPTSATQRDRGAHRYSRSRWLTPRQVTAAAAMPADAAATRPARSGAAAPSRGRRRGRSPRRPALGPTPARTRRRRGWPRRSRSRRRPRRPSSRRRRACGRRCARRGTGRRRLPSARGPPPVMRVEVGGHRRVAAADTALNRSSYGWPEPRLMSVSASALLASKPSMRAVASATVRAVGVVAGVGGRRA